LANGLNVRSQIIFKNMRIGVIGAGVFGATAAIRLAKAGYDVDLIDKSGDILNAASQINQYRLHQGYHYPRSRETIQSCKASAEAFTREYPEAVITGNTHYHCIAAENSLTSAEQFLQMCDAFELPYRKVRLDVIAPEKVALCVEVNENAIDPKVLYSCIKNRLQKEGVRLVLNTPAERSMLSHYDFVVVAAYAGINSVLEAFDVSKLRSYQYELCEKIVVKLPQNFSRKSVVVLDGPFTCFDPFGRSGYFVMGHVVHAIHAQNIGTHPVIPDEFRSLLNRGVIKDPPLTIFSKIIESAAVFFPDIRKAEHIGSMYTFRTVLPGREDTDARPTIVEKINDKIITVFSGKIGNCVEAADKILELIKT